MLKVTQKKMQVVLTTGKHRGKPQICSQSNAPSHRAAHFARLRKWDARPQGRPTRQQGALAADASGEDSDEFDDEELEEAATRAWEVLLD